MRLKDWEQRLVDAILAEQKQPFEWGKHDCAILMAQDVRACYGDDHPSLVEFTKYHDKKSAFRHLKKHGGLEALVSKYFEEVNLLSAQQGDIGILTNDDVQAGCIIMDGLAIGRSETGIWRTPIKNLTKTFHV